MRKLTATIPLVLAVIAASASVGAGPGRPRRACVRARARSSSGWRAARRSWSSCRPRSASARAAAELRQQPGVAYALPNYIAHTSAVPNDRGLFSAAGDWRRTQWNFLPCGSLCGQSPSPLAFEARGGINALAAWDTLKKRGAAQGRGARVAVLDTGVAFANSKPTFVRSPDFASGQFVAGHDFVDGGKRKSKTKGKGLPLDRDGHGTHVTGTIAERTGNKVALTGLVPKAKVIPVRVLDAQGFGTARDIAAGIRFAAKRRRRRDQHELRVRRRRRQLQQDQERLRRDQVREEARRRGRRRRRQLQRRARRLPGRRPERDRGRPQHQGRLPRRRVANRSRPRPGRPRRRPAGAADLRRRGFALQPRRDDLPAHLRRRRLQAVRLSRATTREPRWRPPTSRAWLR